MPHRAGEAVNRVVTADPAEGGPFWREFGQLLRPEAHTQIGLKSATMRWGRRPPDMRLLRTCLGKVRACLRTCFLPLSGPVHAAARCPNPCLRKAFRWSVWTGGYQNVPDNRRSSLTPRNRPSKLSAHARKRPNGASRRAGQVRSRFAPCRCAKSLGSTTWVFDDLKTLLAKATPLRSGDELAGVARRQRRGSGRRADAAGRPAAEPVPGRAAGPLRARRGHAADLDGHDAAAFAPVAGLTVGEFRDWLLSEAATGEALAAPRARA